MLKITGYADRIYCRPGDTIKFMVNCEHPSYRAEMVRIICGDDNPNGPGVKEESIAVPFPETYPGRRQEIHSGSCVLVPNCAATAGLEDFTIQAYIWPTTPLRGRQGIITKWCAGEKSGFALIIDQDGHIALQVGDGTGTVDFFPRAERCNAVAGIEWAPPSMRRRDGSGCSNRPSPPFLT